MDPYQTLGVSRSASQDDIKNAYRNLAKKLHPDLNPGNKEAEHKFKDISAAYELIGTPENRAKFERGEAEARAQAEAYSQGFGGRGPFYYRTQQRGPGHETGGRYTRSFGEGMDEDLFESIFGGMGGGGGFSQARPEQVYQMEVDLKDAILGAEREIQLPTGKKFALKIPPGVTDGTKLKFGEQGFSVELRIRPDSRFQRQGDDLILDWSVSLTDAVFGAEIRVPTPEGNVMLKVPKHSNTGTRLRLSGKGAFSRGKKRRGDEIVVLKVKLPDTIDPELEEALKQWKLRHPGESSSAA